MVRSVMCVYAFRAYSKHWNAWDLVFLRRVFLAVLTKQYNTAISNAAHDTLKPNICIVLVYAIMQTFAIAMLAHLLYAQLDTIASI